MSIELTRSFLLWCTVINYGILLVWFLVFTLAHDWMRRLHGRWFRLSDEQFDTLHNLGMSTYKIGILLEAALAQLQAAYRGTSTLTAARSCAGRLVATVTANTSR